MHITPIAGAGASSLVLAGGDEDCFGPGTRIATVRGVVPVESIHPGDRVCTLLGDDLTQVTWVGRRLVNCARHPEPSKVWPIRVAAGAFGDGMPGIDLILTPDHAVYVDEALIPVRLLVNGRSIRQELAERITYYQIELARHDILMANGLPVESYLEAGGRSRFTNAGQIVALHPDFSARGRDLTACAPLIQAGAALDKVRRRLAADLARRKRRSPDPFPPETSWPS